ncbi:hypothetical protein ACJX0J_029702, partial [Zea mays]
IWTAPEICSYPTDLFAAITVIAGRAQLQNPKDAEDALWNVYVTLSLSRPICSEKW